MCRGGCSSCPWGQVNCAGLWYGRRTRACECVCVCVCAQTPMHVYSPEIKWSWEQAVKLKDSSGEGAGCAGIRKVQGSLKDEQVAW